MAFALLGHAERGCPKIRADWRHIRGVGFLPVILLILPLVTSGCWDRREPEALVFPTVVGFDIDDTGMFKALAQFPNPVARAGGTAAQPTGGGGSSVSFWLNVGKGSTPFEAIKDLALTTSRKLSLSHVDVILISEKLARQGMGPVIEFVLRNYELRVIAKLAIVEGDMKSMLDSEFPLEPAPGIGLFRMLEYVRTEQSQIPDGNFLDKLKTMSSPGFDPTIMRIRVLSTAETQSLIDPGSLSGNLPKPVVKIGGSAVLDGDRMVGWFEASESRGVNWLLGDVARAVAVVDSPLGEGLISLELKQSGCELRPEVSGEHISITAKIGVLARMQDITDYPSGMEVLNPEDPEFVRSLSEKAAQFIRNDINRAIQKARELEVDVFGFGNLVYRKAPKAWYEIVKGQWDTFFAAVDVNLEIAVVLRRPGLTMSSVTPR